VTFRKGGNLAARHLVACDHRGREEGRRTSSLYLRGRGIGGSLVKGKKKGRVLLLLSGESGNVEKGITGCGRYHHEKKGKFPHSQEKIGGRGTFERDLYNPVHKKRVGEGKKKEKKVHFAFPDRKRGKTWGGEGGETSEEMQRSRGLREKGGRGELKPLPIS